MDVRSMTLREFTFIGTYTYTPIDLRATLSKLHSSALGKLGWIEQQPLDVRGRSFRRAAAGAMCGA